MDENVIQLSYSELERLSASLKGSAMDLDMLRSQIAVISDEMCMQINKLESDLNQAQYQMEEIMTGVSAKINETAGTSWKGETANYFQTVEVENIHTRYQEMENILQEVQQRTHSYLTELEERLSYYLSKVAAEQDNCTSLSDTVETYSAQHKMIDEVEA